VNLEQIREIVRTVTIQNTMLCGGAIVVRGLDQDQLLEILLLAQQQLCEQDSKVPTQNPS